MFPSFAFGLEDKPLYFYFHLINLNVALLFNNRNCIVWEFNFSKCLEYFGDGNEVHVSCKVCMP